MIPEGCVERVKTGFRFGRIVADFKIDRRALIAYIK